MSEMNEKVSERQKKYIFVVGEKCVAQYGGYESFIDKLTKQYQYNSDIQYHIITKANGDGHMDESKLNGITPIDGYTFIYHGARIVKLQVPQIGPVQATAYDIKTMIYCLKYCEENSIASPIFYILTCRIGSFFGRLVKRSHDLGGNVFVNPDGDGQIIATKNKSLEKLIGVAA